MNQEYIKKLEKEITNYQEEISQLQEKNNFLEKNKNQKDLYLNYFPFLKNYNFICFFCREELNWKELGGFALNIPRLVPQEEQRKILGCQICLKIAYEESSKVN